MTDAKFIKCLEEYITSENKEQYLSKLLPGTEEHTYMTLTHDLNKLKDGEKPSKDLKKRLDKAIPIHANNNQIAIRFKFMLKKLESEEDEAKRKKIAKKINNLYFSFGFHYKRPQNADGMMIEDEEEKKQESTLKKNFYDDYTKNITNLSKQNLSYFNDVFFPTLNQMDLEADLKKCLSKDPTQFINKVRELPSISHLSYLPKMLVKFLNDSDKMDISGILLNLPLKQLNQIAKEVSFVKLNKTFVEVLYNKTFKHTIKHFKDIRELKRVYLWSMSKNIHELYPKIKRTVNLRILDLMAKEGKTDLELFEDYIKDPVEKDNYFSKAFRKKPWAHDWTDMRFNDVSCDQLKVIVSHLGFLYKQGKDIMKYKNFFKKMFLKKLKIKFSLLSGNKEPKATEVYSKSELDALNQDKYIKFLTKNIDSLKPSDIIEIEAELKNVKNLIVQIFEVNTINYIKDLKMAIPQDIRLDGLISVLEKTYTFDQAPILEHKKKFSFPELKNFERGVFIINFIGDGISSRIVLRRGSLQLIKEKSRGGSICYMIDENGEICRGNSMTKEEIKNVDDQERTGFYDNSGEFYHADSNGLINYPFGKGTQKLVLVHKGFGYFHRELFGGEVISVRTNWIFDEETFLPGNQSHVLLNLRMLVNDNPVPISNFNSCSVELEFSKGDNDKTTQKFENLPLNESEDNMISFYIPNKVQSINFKTTTTYMSVQQKEMQTSTQNMTVTFITREGSLNKAHIFLQKTHDQGNIVYVKGKNGEPISNVNVDIEFFFVWKKISIHKKLISDQNGRIILGNLDGVYALRINSAVKKIDFDTFFYLEDKNSRLFNEANIHVINEGELFQATHIPCYFKEGPEYALYNVRDFSSLNVIKDLTSQVRVIDNEVVKVDKLKIGMYHLVNLRTGDKFNIEVIQKKEINEKLILYNGKYYQKKEVKQVISNINQIKQSGDKVKIVLDDFNAKTRIHILNSVFQPEGENYNRLPNSFSNSHGVKYETIKKIVQKSDFIEKSSLSGEMLYALKRKTMNKAIGMTSEKPKLFLKGKNNKTTSYENERVDDYLAVERNDFSDSDYESSEEIMFRKESNMRKMPRKRKMAKKKKKKGGRGRANVHYYNLSKIGYPSSASKNSLRFEKMRSFLKSSGGILANLKPNQDGEVEFSVSNFQGSFLRIYVINDSYLTQKSFTLQNKNNITFKDLTLPKSRDIDKTFAYVREVFKIKENAKQKIANYTAADVEVVDTLSRVIEIINNFSNSYTGSDDNWEFLKNWEDHEFEELTAYIDKYFSHELNFFIFKRDRELFDSIIKPFLECKLKKDFIDYYLLQDMKTLVTYLNPHKIASLSTIEKVLLIDATHKEHKKTCENILEILKGEDFMNDYTLDSGYEYIFDKLINMNEANRVELKIRKKKFKMKKAQVNYNDRSFDDSIVSDQSFEMEQRNVDFEQEFNDANECEEPFPFEEQIMLEEEDLFSNNAMMENIAPMQMQMNIAAPIQQRNIAPVQQQMRFSPIQQQMNIASPRPRVIRRAPSGRNMRERRRLPHIRNPSFDDDDEEGFSETESGDEEMGDRDSVYNDYRLKIGNDNRKVNIRKINLSSMKNTVEFVERSYLSNARNASTNKFWVEVASHILNNSGEPFLSENFVYCSRDQIPFVISFLNLDSEAESYEFTEEEKSYFINVKNNTILFFKHLKENDECEEDNSNNILAAQKWFDSTEREIYDPERNKKVEKKVKYFLKGKIYGSQLVISNVSSLEQDIQIITEVPQGSIPISKNDFHLNYDVKISPFSTKKYEFYFYFPKEGEYNFCPACITCDNKRINVQASNTTIKVLEKRPIGNNLQNISDILDRGSKTDILNFMRKNNISNPKIFNFDSIYWLLKDAEFYKETINILKEKEIFNQGIWGFSFYHGDINTISELFEKFTATKAWEDYLSPPPFFFRFNKLIHNNFTIYEYNPIINSRFHQMDGDKTVILNKDLKNTYLNFLLYFFEKEEFNTPDDYLIMAYYLLLQDRTDEAIQFTKKITNPSKINFKIQYDYMMAYFDMYTGMPKFTKAREICEKNIAYPIESWRNLFVEMANQIADYDGELDGNLIKDKDDKEDEDKEMLNVKLEGSKLNLLYQKIENIQVDFFLIDLEILFSISPFLGKEFEKLVYIQPHSVLKRKVVSKKTLEKLDMEIPEELKEKNLVIKVTGDKQKSILVYSYTTLKVSENVNSGMIKVCDEALKPLAKTYVKCFSMTTSGAVEFFKDGYTDIRGSFNYCDIKNSNISNISKFSLFVHHEKYGSVIKEIKQPNVVLSKLHIVNPASSKWQMKQNLSSKAHYGKFMNRAKNRKMKSKKSKY